MKRITLLIIAIIVITSCSSEKEIIEKEVPKLLNKQVTKESYDDDGDPNTPNKESIRTSTLQYNEKYELIKAINESAEGKSERIFTYTDGVITKAEDIDNDGNLEMYQEHEYTDKLLTKLVKYNSKGEINSTETYEYNSDLKIIKNTHKLFYNGGSSVYIENYEYLANNKIKISEQTSHNNGKYTIYTFDSKNSPLINITGFKPLLALNNESGSIQNPTLIQSFSKDNIEQESTVITYKYDSDNFITERIESNGTNESIITYEYNK